MQAQSYFCPECLSDDTLMHSADGILHADGCSREGRFDRERLIAVLSWWSGWCTDHDGVLPDLARLGAVLLDAKHQLALDREPEDEWCREENCQYRHWVSGDMPTHKRGSTCPPRTSASKEPTNG